MFQGVVTNILPAVLTPMTEIKQSSCKIGDDQAIKMSICAVQMKVKMGPVLWLHPSHTPRLAIKGQGSFSGAIKQSRPKNGPDQTLIPVTGVSTVDYVMRFMTYWQLTGWCWGWLGRTMRVTLPSCAVNKIRTKFLSSDGNYTGFNYPIFTPWCTIYTLSLMIFLFTIFILASIISTSLILSCHNVWPLHGWLSSRLRSICWINTTSSHNSLLQ